ncbi:MAG: hypothetical protein GXC76_16805 [Rhodanobacteraceae bacterium]|nr:hypothetical protein [Rhodanobacteraceae bacterium]
MAAVSTPARLIRASATYYPRRWQAWHDPHTNLQDYPGPFMGKAIVFDNSLRRAALAALLVACPTVALAGNVTIPHSFTAHTPAVAAEVNANFDAAANAINGNAADIAALQAAVAQLQALVTTQQTALDRLDGSMKAQQARIDVLNDTVAAQQARIDALDGTIAAQQSRIDALDGTIAAQQALIADVNGRLAAVQNSSVMALAPYLELVLVPEPSNPAVSYRTARFSGINLQVVNGLGNTETRNGLGNLIVGYNEPGSVPKFCSLGEYDGDQATCVGNGGIWAANQRSGSHNLVVGFANGYSRFGGLVAGMENVINGEYASVGAGMMNKASGEWAWIAGGGFNTASGKYASVGGGYLNLASGDRATVAAGYQNTAGGDGSSVSGGRSSTANGSYSSIGGGYENVAAGYAATVSGGTLRSAPGPYNWVAGSLREIQ